MTREEIYQRMNEIFSDLFLSDGIELNDSTTADYVDGWDSLTNINLIMAVESSFGFKFNLGEYEGFKNLGEMVTAIQRRIV